MRYPGNISSKRNRKFLCSALCAATLLFPGSHGAASAPARENRKGTNSSTNKFSLSQPVAKDLKFGIEEYKLANGMNILLVKRATTPVVTVNMIYHVGSRNEAVGYTGSTHFLEHLMFKGTNKFDPLKGNGLDDVLKKVGGINNATTSYDRTNYFEVVPKNSIKLALELEADRMRNLLLRKDDRDAEMTVVRNELERGEDEPSDLLMNMVYATAFREHPYHHPVIGWRSDVEGVPLARLRKFYDDFYYPDNATLVVVGDFDKAETLSLIDKLFSPIPRSKEKMPAVYTKEPKQEGERRFVVSRGKELPRILIGYHVPRATDAATAPLDIIASALGDSSRKNSRLYKSLVETGLCSEVSCANSSLLDPSLFLIQATVQPDKNPKQVEAVILAEVDRLVKENVTSSELSRGQSSIVKRFKLALSDPMGFAQSITEGVAVANWQWWVAYPHSIMKVTLQDTAKQSATTFGEENRTVGIYLPVGTKLSQFAAAGEVTLPPLVQDETETKVASIDLKPQGAAGTQPGKSGLASRIKKITLPNGLTFLLLPSSTRDGTVAMSGKVRAGDFFAPPPHTVRADLLAKIMSYGTTTLSKKVLAQKLESMGVSLEFDGESFFHDFDCEVVNEDLAELLKITFSCLTEPAFDEKDFAEVKKLSVAELKEDMAQTHSQAWNKLLEKLYKPGYVYHSPSFEAQIKDVEETTIEDLKEHHRRFYNPSNTVISLVGDFDGEKTEKFIQETFAKWQKGEGSQVKISDEGLTGLGATRLTTDLPDKNNVDIVLARPVPVSVKSKDYLPTLIGNAVLGYDSFACRLAPVRDRYGLTYSIYSRIVDPEYAFSPWAIELSVNPENIEKSLKIVRSIVADFTSKGITQAEFEKEKSHLAGAFQVGLRSPRALAKKISEYEQLSIPMTNLDNLPQRLSKVELAQVNKAIKDYFALDKASLSIAGNLGKSEHKEQ